MNLPPHLPLRALPGIVIMTFLLLLCAPSISVAQLSVSLSSAKKELVAYEPVRVTISITNRSSNPILLASPTGNGESWIRFLANNERGDTLPITGVVKDQTPIQIRPAETIQRSVDLGAIFPLADYGAYNIQASVYCSPDRAYSPSNRIRVNIVGARELWSAAFGVPHGKEGGGTSRVFRLLQYRSMDDVQLYVRLDDRSTGMVLSCYSIGKLLEMTPPTYGMDVQGNLHILYQNTPNISYHVIVDSSGKVTQRQAYQEYTSSRPALSKGSDGSVRVMGGRQYDAVAQAAQRLSTRKASERPAGLDQIIGQSAPKGPRSIPDVAPAPQDIPSAPFAPLDLPADGQDPNYEPLAPKKGR